MRRGRMSPWLAAVTMLVAGAPESPWNSYEKS
jgi:hypothetical protein